MCRQALFFGVGARANNLVLEACPLLFLYKGLWCLRCSDVMGTDRLLDFHERGKHGLRKKTQLSTYLITT